MGEYDSLLSIPHGLVVRCMRRTAYFRLPFYYNTCARQRLNADSPMMARHDLRARNTRCSWGREESIYSASFLIKLLRRELYYISPPTFPARNACLSHDPQAQSHKVEGGRGDGTADR